jgi:chromate reductase
MSETRDVAVFVGSLRRESWTRRVAVALGRLSPPQLKLEIVEIGDLPLYNQDLETDSPPEQWVRLRDRIRAADAVLFATPEYNRSVPGVLKNAIDVGSRPPGKAAWKGKPGAVVSVSPGAIGAFGANHHLRQSLVFLEMPTLQQPEVYLGGVANLVDADGNITNDSTHAFLENFMSSFAHWIEVQRCQP